MTERRTAAQQVMSAQLRKVAPGTRLREAIDMIISARSGALIVVGDMEQIAPVCDGGFTIDMPFTAQRMFELAKMDGAIILDHDCERIAKANVHLVPDSDLATTETGMRHRTAERVSRQTEALVISISQRRSVVNLYLRGRRTTLEEIEVLIAKANQAIQIMQNYRNRLDEMLERLTLLEFEELGTLGDVAEVVGRFDMLRRVQRELSRYTLELGTEGRLMRMQADELTSGISEQYSLVLRDYADDPAPRRVTKVREHLADLPPDRLFEPEAIAHEMGLVTAEHSEQHLRPRGYRALAQIPMIPASVAARIVERFGNLGDIARASIQDLDSVDGVGLRRAQAIKTGLERLKAHVSL